MVEDPDFVKALAQTRVGLSAMGSGDPAPYQACWSENDDSTLLGAWGTVERGHADINATLEWVGSRFSGGALTSEYEVVHVGEDVAYTVGFERGNVEIDGADEAPIVIRVTHIYRKEQGEWKLAHRHADHPPVLKVRPRLGESS